MIAADDFCTHYNVTYTFLQTLEESGLIELVRVEGRGFIPSDSLPDVERFIRLHYELGINVEGLEAITHLLSRMHRLQNEISLLKNRLRFHENREQQTGLT